MIYNVIMSCGHSQLEDLADTGEQLKLDLDYFRRQGLCHDCWEKLIERNNKARAEMLERRKARKDGQTERHSWKR